MNYDLWINKQNKIINSNHSIYPVAMLLINECIRLYVTYWGYTYHTYKKYLMFLHFRTAEIFSNILHYNENNIEHTHYTIFALKNNSTWTRENIRLTFYEIFQTEFSYCVIAIYLHDAAL